MEANYHFMHSELKPVQTFCPKPNFPGFTAGGIVIATLYNQSPNPDTEKVTC